MMQNVAKTILGCGEVEKLPQAGARNIAFYVSVGKHKYSDKFKRVSCKFYRGNGKTKGFLNEYMPFHKIEFQKQTVLNDNPLVLQSLDAGVFESDKNSYPYAVFQYVDGIMLRDFVEDKSKFISKEFAKSILSDIFLNVWIPIWSASIRFQDSQTGNWVLGSDKRTYMIDTEQMRKDVFELEYNPTSWAKRDSHEKLGLSKIAGIYTDLCNKANVPMTNTKAKNIIAQTEFFEALKSLGRQRNNSIAEANNQFQRLLELFLQ